MSREEQIIELQTELDQMVDDGALVKSVGEGEPQYSPADDSDEYLDDNAYSEEMETAIKEDEMMESAILNYPGIASIVQ